MSQYYSIDLWKNNTIILDWTDSFGIGHLGKRLPPPMAWSTTHEWAEILLGWSNFVFYLLFFFLHQSDLEGLRVNRHRRFVESLSHIWTGKNLNFFSISNQNNFFTLIAMFRWVAKVCENILSFTESKNHRKYLMHFLMWSPLLSRHLSDHLENIYCKIISYMRNTMVLWANASNKSVLI